MKITHSKENLKELLEAHATDFGALCMSVKKGRVYLSSDRDDFTFKLIKFRMGDEIRQHSHSSGPIYKLLICGRIRYEDDEVLVPGEIASVDAGVSYRGLALEDSIMLLLEPKGCRVE